MQPLLQKLFLLLFSLGSMLSFAQSGTAPPEILAEGDQFYCPLSEINVVTEFSINNPSGAILDGFYVQISSGYVRGSDVLKLGVDQDNIRDSWNSMTGKLSLTSKNGNPLELDDIIAAVKDVVFESRDDVFSGERLFSFTIGDANYLPSTGHYYEFINDVGITWQQAKVAAEALNYSFGPYQNEPYFENVLPGIHTLYVREKMVVELLKYRCL